MAGGPDSSERDARELTVEAEAESVGAAKWRAMKELEGRFPGITVECVDFHVVADGNGGDAARVVGRVDEEAWQAAAAATPDEPVERLRALVTRVLQALELDAVVEISETDEELRATVNGGDVGLLIGKHGATIDALQHLAVRFALRGEQRDKRIVIDAAGYRARREDALHRAADRAAAEAVRYGRPVELEPMRPLERRVVHLYLRDRPDVESHSEGQEPERRLVVTPAPRPQPSP